MVLQNRKALKLVVCMSLIVALAISALSISVWATFENTHYNSGDQASDIVGVAATQVGYAEGYNSYTKYGDWYGLPNSDWCAMFVSWCANQAGVDTSVFPSFALCSAGADWFMSQGRFHYSGSYTPQAGDLIFYASYGSIYHVGLVTGSDDSNVYSIEGNYNEMVSNVSYSLGYGDILGYASPDYGTASGSPAIDDSDDESDSELSYVDSEKTDSDVIDLSTDSYIDATDSEEDKNSDSDSDSDSDTEEITSDSDSDSDTDSQTTDTDSDTDTASDTDKNTDSESDTDTATDTDSNTGTDTSSKETDTDTESNTDSDNKTDSVKGDVNGDGVVDVLDSLLVQRYLVLNDLAENINLKNADVNGSGSVDIGDALIILKMSVGLA